MSNFITIVFNLLHLLQDTINPRPKGEILVCHLSDQLQQVLAVLSTGGRKFLYPSLNSQGHTVPSLIDRVKWRLVEHHGIE